MRIAACALFVGFVSTALVGCGGIDDCAEQLCPSGSSCVDVSSSDFAGCEPDPG